MQLVRESVTTRYIQGKFPLEIQGIYIYVPISNISLGANITCKSSLASGTSIFNLLYSQDPNDLKNAQQYGLVALQALRSVKKHSLQFYFFGYFYYWYRLIKLIILSRKYALLPQSNQIRLNRMILTSARRNESQKVLMHGDLHVGNLIVDAYNRRLAIIDTELMGVGKAVTDFAHLWIGYYFAKADLGKSFYTAYKDQNPIEFYDIFDNELRAEIALKCYFMIIKSKEIQNRPLEDLSTSLLKNMIGFGNFEEFLSSTHS